MTKLIVTFRNFANAPKIVIFEFFFWLRNLKSFERRFFFKFKILIFPPIWPPLEFCRPGHPLATPLSVYSDFGRLASDRIYNACLSTLIDAA